jgi:cytochrome P450
MHPGSAPTVELRPDTEDFLADPYPAFARLRERHPIVRMEGSTLICFTRHADIMRLLQDPRLGRTMDHTLSREALDARRRAAQWHNLPNYSRYVRVNLLETEGADHTRLRGVLTKLINPMRIRALRERVQQVVNDLLTPLIALGRMDFIADLAEPLPVYMIADWLGWPSELRHRLRPWSAAIVKPYEPDHTSADEQRAEAAATEFAAALEQVIEARRAAPRDDLISALAAQEGQPDTLSRDELIATCMLVLNAGHEATVNGAGNALLALLRRPGQLSRLRAEPALMTSAIEELLRYDSPLQLFRRYVLEDMESAGIRLQRGVELGFLYGCANRDEAAFPHADALDLARRPNPHLAFGGGRHYCVGAPLARMELECLFRTLFERIPHIELAEPEPPRRPGFVFRGLQRLMLQW